MNDASGVVPRSGPFWAYWDTRLDATFMGKPVPMSGQNYFEVFMLGDNINFFVSSTASLPTFIPVPVAGRWHHIGVTHDGSTLTLYIDGAPQSRTSTPRLDTGSRFLIGCDQDDGTYKSWFSGCMADVRVYSAVLDDAEIATLAR